MFRVANFGGIIAICAWSLISLPAYASPTIVAGVSEGVTTDIFDITLPANGVRLAQTAPASTASPIFEYGRAIGLTSAGGETTHMIFSDAGGAGTVQQFTFNTVRPINLTNFNAYLAQDGVSNNRSASRVRLLGSSDGVTYSVISDSAATVADLSVGATGYIGVFGGAGGITMSENVTTTAQFFRLETTKEVGAARRVYELDGFGALASNRPVNATVFNATTNAGGDEAAGLGTNFTFSSNVLGTDTVIDAFGNNDGAVEPASFIFGDSGGVADNGDAVFGNGGETVDFIEWHTTAPIVLGGIQIDLAGDGVSAARDTELVRLIVEGNVVDIFDNNGANGIIDRIFSGAYYADDFRLEFTRTVAGSGGRINEINAITADITAVPEPASLAVWSLLALLGAAYGMRRHCR